MRASYVCEMMCVYISSGSLKMDFFSAPWDRTQCDLGSEKNMRHTHTQFSGHSAYRARYVTQPSVYLVHGYPGLIWCSYGAIF